MTNTDRNIVIRELAETDLHPGLLGHFNRHQDVVKVWRIISGNKVLVEDPFVEEWDEELRREIVQEDFAGCVKNGGVVIGGFHEGRLIAFASMPYYFFGSKKEYVQLMQIHVSYEYRGLGIGKRLFEACAEKAREWGAKKLYISAHSSEETQGFYLSLGCTDAEEVNKRLAEYEPFDIQMEYVL